MKKKHLTKIKEIDFHFYNNDAISLYFTFVGIYRSKTNQDLKKDTDVLIRKIITMAVSNQSKHSLKIVKESLDSLLKSGCCLKI